MLHNKFLYSTIFLLITLFLSGSISYAGNPSIPDTDRGDNFTLFSFFDLRERESFVQVTNTASLAGTVHVQIFDVGNNCNENNFFDNYTGNDTHVYNLRDIQTNDGNPSGIVLPEGAYGIVSIITVSAVGGGFSETVPLIGNFRIVDNNGYEYRTNSINPGARDFGFWLNESITFNYNTKGGITLSDIVGVAFAIQQEVFLDISNNLFFAADVDILNEDEVVFSCRNVIFACTDQGNPLNESLLEQVGNASVASFEYGINNAIPHSKGGELLCPGNIISDGFVTLNLLGDFSFFNFFGFVGLNNGDGRGSMDSLIYPAEILSR